MKFICFTSCCNAIILRQVSKLNEIENPEGYRLKITPKLVTIEATTDAGLFYGLQTLLQLMDEDNSLLHLFQIEMYPKY